MVSIATKQTFFHVNVEWITIAEILDTYSVITTGIFEPNQNLVIGYLNVRCCSLLWHFMNGALFVNICLQYQSIKLPTQSPNGNAGLVSIIFCHRWLYRVHMNANVIEGIKTVVSVGSVKMLDIWH